MRKQAAMCYYLFVKNRQVHFVGIGGIGASALARWYMCERWKVTGSDVEGSEIIDALREEGIPISVGPHDPKNLPSKTALVVYSAAAEKSDEVERARAQKIKTQSYAEALGKIARGYSVIAVAGSHGKSTTTALISMILIAAGLDPTVVIGTKLREFTPIHRWQEAWLNSGAGMGSNFRRGKSKILVIEADEWRGAFWNYAPAIAVITNIDREHLDFYKTYRGVEAAFRKFALRVVPGGRIVINADDIGACMLGERLLKDYPKRFLGRIHFYSVASLDAARLRPHLFLSGRHNASNAMAAMMAAKALNIPMEIVEGALSSFHGSWRRFEYMGRMNGALIIADYAHHPTEIRATLSVARARFPQKKIYAVFQPHHHDRTKRHFREFAEAFVDADAVYLLDIYGVAGREQKQRDPEAHSFHLARAISENGKEAYYIPYRAMIHEIMEEKADADAVFLMMGAGSIGKMAREIMPAVYPFCKINEDE